ncbi:MAG: DUF2268 domain-containing putative Zn-dependent protease [bacterium]|nr:DUF2268 domain-containing putative Zn-dependent protease [bacterium]
MSNIDCFQFGTVRVHTLFSGNQKGFQKLLRAGVLDTIKIHTQKLMALFKTYPQVDIVLLDDKEMVIKEYGVGGFTPRKHLMYLYFDLAFDNLKGAVEKHVPATLAHEFHHLVRWQTVGYGDTLFDAIVSEGSAVVFEEAYAGFTPLYARSLSPTQESKIQKQLQRDLQKKDYDRMLWFWGNRGFPRSAGYRLGYKLAQDYLAKHPTAKPEDLASIPTKDFSRLSL